MTNTNPTSTRVARKGVLRWVPIADILVNPMAQRELRPGWAAQIATDFDPDRFSPPLLSLRGGKYYVIDGQHRIEAMRIMGWDDQQVECWVYEGLDEAGEADLFLWHNNRKAVSSFDQFQIAVVAGREDECEIARIVHSLGLKVSNDKDGIHAVGALKKVYAHGGPVLKRSLRMVRDAYGTSGLSREVIEGMGLLCSRYNGDLDDNKAVQRLATVHGGVNGLTGKAHQIKKTTGASLGNCVAAAAVEIINAGRGGKKLPNWWSA